MIRLIISSIFSILFLSFAPALHAQQLIVDGKGITLAISPERIRLNGEVTISGTSVPGRQNRVITAVFKPPHGSSLVRKFKMDRDGTFRYTEKRLQICGRWEVAVKGPVIKETARGTFDVLSPVSFAAHSIHSIQEALETDLKLLNDMKQQAVKFPELPEKERAIGQMNELVTVFKDMKYDWNQVGDALQHIEKALPDLSFFPETQPVMDQLAQRLQQQEQRIKDIERQLRFTHEELNNAREWCRMWFVQKKCLKLFFKSVETILTGGKGLLEWESEILTGYIKNTWKEMTLNASQTVLNLSGEQKKKAEKALGRFDLAENIIANTFGRKGSILEARKKVAFTAIDGLIDWISTKVAKNCRMYNASVKGKLVISYYTKRVVYMVAKYRFDGGMELFFQKRKNKNDIVRLKGEIWGNFDWRIGKFFPQRVAEDIPGVWAFGLCVPRPPFLDYRDFSLVLEGQGLPDGVKLKVTKASYDKEKLKYRYISPYSGLPIN